MVHLFIVVEFVIFIHVLTASETKVFALYSEDGYRKKQLDVMAFAGCCHITEKVWYQRRLVMGKETCSRIGNCLHYCLGLD